MTTALLGIDVYAIIGLVAIAAAMLYIWRKSRKRPSW